MWWIFTIWNLNINVKIYGTAKNRPFVIWTHLFPQLFILGMPQYTKYSGIPKT